MKETYEEVHQYNIHEENENDEDDPQYRIRKMIFVVENIVEPHFSSHHHHCLYKGFKRILESR